MRLRVFIIDPNDTMRESIALHVESLGYEVIMASSAETCPHYHADRQSCIQENVCGDAMIFGQELPTITGIDFIARRLKGGCKGAAANSAIICRPWSYEEEKRADELGCRFFETPILLADITAWLMGVAETRPAGHRLAPLPRDRSMSD